jgi:SAM-dependent methyltransferase
MQSTRTARTISSIVTDSALVVGRRILPSQFRQWLRHSLGCWPPIGWVRFGSLRRVTPISAVFGLDRGTAVDRYYIENFLARHAFDIHGRVLEIADRAYTTRFGGDRVAQSDVLHVQEGNPKATIVADLTCDNHIAPDSFDCIILTQTLQFIYDVRAAVSTLHRILRPGGVLLATIPGISQISRYDMKRWGEYWRFTTLSAQRLFAEAFGPMNVSVEAHGNVLVASAFLYGLTVEDLHREQLDARDHDYEVLITVRAAKTEEKL